jgi:hypothetical protein
MVEIMALKRNKAIFCMGYDILLAILSQKPYRQ